MTTQAPPKAVDAPIGWLDERLGTAGFLRGNMKKVFPDHWSFMLGEIALYCFIILLLTGTFLTLWFKPEHVRGRVPAALHPARGVKMSEAYASTLHISFDVRGGLLMRQIHHWAAILFVASIVGAHAAGLLHRRVPQAARGQLADRPGAVHRSRILEGLAGYSLPDDLLSGTGLRITAGRHAVDPAGRHVPVVLRCSAATSRARTSSRGCTRCTSC